MKNWAGLVPFARYPQNMSSASQIFSGFYFSSKNAGRICGGFNSHAIANCFQRETNNFEHMMLQIFLARCQIRVLLLWSRMMKSWGYVLRVVWIAGSLGRIGKVCCEELKILKWGWRSGRMSFLWEKSGTWRWIVINSKQSKGFFLGFTSLCLMGSWVLGEAVMSATSLRPSQLDEELRKRGREDSMVHVPISTSQNSSV